MGVLLSESNRTESTSLLFCYSGEMALQPRNVARLVQTCVRQKSTSTVKTANQTADKYYTKSSSDAASSEKKKTYSGGKTSTTTQKDSKYQREGHLLWHL